MKNLLSKSTPFVLSISIGLLVWHFSVLIFHMPSYVLPQPYDVTISLLEGLNQDPFYKTSFLYHLADTMRATLIGFFFGAIFGLVISSLMAEFRFIEASLLPYVVGLQSLPKVAIAPLLVIWFGYGMESKVAMAFILTLFPVLINSLAGFRSSPRERIELMLSLRSTRFQVFRMIKLPGAMPMVFTGLNLGVVYAMLGTLVAEFSGGQQGVGVIMMQMQAVSDTASVFAMLVLLALTGFILLIVMQSLQRKFIFWMEDDRKEGAT